MEKRRKKFDKSLGFVAVVLIPVFLQYTLTTVVPMVMSFVLTFTDWSLIGAGKLIGLANWRQWGSDPLVWQSLKITVFYALLVVIPTVVMGLGLALLINRRCWGVGFFKGGWFLPVITSTIVIASIWKWLFSAEDNGIINSFLGFLGIAPQFFLGSRMALTTVAMLGVFQSLGTAMVYFFAGLKGIETDMIEAARVDGCTGGQRFFYITLPLLKPTFTYVLIIMTSGALKVFDSVYTLFNQTGGPENSANVLVMHIWRTSFFSMKMGYGSTIAYLLFFLILMISLFQFWLTSKDIMK